jgi:hypothetical protein
MAYGIAMASMVTSAKRNHPYVGVDDFDTEYDARLLLIQTWKTLTAEKPERDLYLDQLVRIHGDVQALPTVTIPARRSILS